MQEIHVCILLAKTEQTTHIITHLPDSSRKSTLRPPEPEFEQLRLFDE
jgi:hypothetical protein